MKIKKEHYEPMVLNKEQRLFVIRESYGYSCLGFDVLNKKARSLATELETAWTERIGTKKAYKRYCALIKLAWKKNKETGWRSSSELHPQLIGLEGRRVEVTDQEGEVYRFKVGRSTGVVPIHLQLDNARSDGGYAVDSRPFKKVVVIR